MAKAQNYYSKNATVVFNASSPIEKIEGTTRSGTLIYDSASGQLESAILVKGFQFESALMQEHFNENYMESDKFPKASFKGKIENPATLTLNKDGKYTATLNGKLTIHGVTQPLITKATFVVKGATIVSNAVFDIEVAKFGIKIPSLVAEKIAKTAKISISSNMSVLNK